MTDKSTLLSRIEQVIKLGTKTRPRTIYDDIAEDTSNKKLNDLITSILSTTTDNTGKKVTRKADETPVVKIGPKGSPRILVNLSKTPGLVEPLYITLETQMRAPKPLLSKDWLETEHDSAEPIADPARKSVKAYEDVTRMDWRAAYAERFINLLKTAVENNRTFAPDAFKNKREEQYEGQERGEGAHVVMDPNKDLPELKEKETEGRWEKPDMTAAGKISPHEHFRALWDAISSSISPQDFKHIKDEVGTSGPFARFYKNGRLVSGHKKLKDDYDEEVDKAKKDLINSYFEKYVDKDTGEFTEDAPEIWKTRYETARTEELAHREAVNIADREALFDTKDEEGRQIPNAPKPWYVQLKVKRIEANPVNGKGAIGKWERKDKNGKWRTHTITGSEVYKVEGLGDIIVQNLDGMRVRVFAPSKDAANNRIDPNLNKPRIFTNTKGVDAIIQAYYEQRLPKPADYNPPHIKPIDWKVVSDIQKKLYLKAKEGAMQFPAGHRELEIERIDKKYADIKKKLQYQYPKKTRSEYLTDLELSYKHLMKHPFSDKFIEYAKTHPEVNMKDKIQKAHILIKKYYKEAKADALKYPDFKKNKQQMLEAIEKQHEAAKQRASTLPQGKRGAYLEAIENKYKAWNTAISHSGPEYDKLWRNWFSHMYWANVTKGDDAKYNQIKSILEIGGGSEEKGALSISDTDMQFYLDFQTRIKKLVKLERPKFNVAFEQRSMMSNSQGFSPLDSPDVNAPIDNSKKLADDALTYEINRRVKKTPLGQERDKWQILMEESRERVMWLKDKDKTPRDAGDEGEGYEGEGEEEEEEAPVEVDDRGRLVERGMSEPTAADLEELENVLNLKPTETDEEDEDVDIDSEEEEDNQSSVEEVREADDKGPRTLEEMRLEWLSIRAKIAASKANIEYASAKASIIGRPIKISGIYADDNKNMYDLIAFPDGKKRNIINKRGLSPKNRYEGIYAFDDEVEAFFTSVAFNKAAMKPEPSEAVIEARNSLSRRAWGLVWEQYLGPEPPQDGLPPPATDSVIQEPTQISHRTWERRLENAFNIAVEDKDYERLDTLYEAYPQYTNKFRLTLDPRELSPSEITKRNARQRAEEKRVARLKEGKTPEIDWNIDWAIQNPKPRDGQSQSDYTKMRNEWGKDLVDKYKKASPRMKEYMTYSYKQFAAANPKEPHPFDKITDLKKIRDAITEAKSQAPVKDAIKDVLDRVNDRTLRTTIRKKITDKNEENRKFLIENKRAKQGVNVNTEDADKKAEAKGMAHISEYVEGKNINDEVNRQIAQIKEDSLSQIEQEYNVTIDRDTNDFTPNEGGITVPAPKKKTAVASKPKEAEAPPKEKKTPAVEKEPESTTFEDEFFGETKEEPPAEKKPPLEKIKDKIKRVSSKKIKEPLKEKESSIKPKSTRWLDAFNDSFFNKPNSAKIETEKVRPETPPKDKNKSTRWLDAFNDEFFNTSSTPPKSKTTSTEKPAPKPTRWLDAFNDSFFGETS